MKKKIITSSEIFVLVLILIWCSLNQEGMSEDEYLIQDLFLTLFTSICMGYVYMDLREEKIRLGKKKVEKSTSPYSMVTWFDIVFTVVLAYFYIILNSYF